MTAETEQRESLLQGTADQNRYSSIDVAAVQKHNVSELTAVDAVNCLSSRRATAKINVDAVGARGSIFLAPVASKLPEGDAPVKKAQSTLIQALIFAVMVLSSGLTPQINIYLRKQKGAQKFHFLTPYFFDYLLSVTVANIISLFLHGKKGLKDCWNFRAILLFAPTAVFATLSESLTTRALDGIGGTSFRLIKQLKLPLTALGVYFVLRRKTTTSTQWSLIFAMTLAVLGYFVGNNPNSGPDNMTTEALAMTSFSVLAAVAGSLLADFTYKKIDFPLIIQIPQVRVTNILVCFMLVLGFCYKENTWKQFFLFEGWDFKLVLFIIFLVAKDWLSTFVFKHMDSLWKAIGGALSLCITYFVDIAVTPSKFNLTSFFFVSSVVVDIVAFSLTKRDAAKLKASQAKQA